ncbi:D-isomer specific 2-hydroxyacid dehydrogenase NAD-binding protein [Thermovibrio ammonificans HB-1]|uniref:D-isomer specific 2-hydroxyacid dehydrogenase NAD-binding protein n=1 Tax=Thermovibrio ammonificans (strain DSM 15698 / JCM 12110 / HB-1) TaxID=648996 RepID=E8T245_THEA1|nr:hydroxyacid dehydrogenase [Thermovibrio ammonificans]ADU96940.1 D-isomer specific 2-hydroxyacid dehydrogenase NAD-binding protein [Thermovibrio ammonificans HB-1]
MKVAFFELEGWEEPVIRETLEPKGFEIVTLSREPLKESDIERIKDVEALSVFIYSKVDRKVIETLPNLKIVTTRSTGFDHIDVEAARERGIAVCNVPDYGMETVAEYALLMILALLRKLKPTIERTCRGIFSREGLRGHDLAGKTVGVIGTGRIGARLVKLLSGFDVKVLAYDVKPKEELVERFGVEYVSLEELLSRSDIVSLHVPYLPSTHHLINRENIKLMKKGSYLVNTSRGAVVETDAIVEALKEGRLAGVALDTFEGEEVWTEEELIIFRGEKDVSPEVLKKAIETFALAQFDNVILSPHNAYNTHEAIMRILTKTLKNLVEFKEKGRCTYPVYK